MQAPAAQAQQQQAAITTTSQARYACLASMVPLLLWGASPMGVQRAALAYLLLVPLTAPPLQRFAASSGPAEHATVTRELCRLALFLGSVAALLLLMAPCVLVGGPSLLLARVAHGLVAGALCLGCTQLLIMVHKGGNVLRVMGCTAAAVIVAALAFASVLAPVALARRFFQSAVLPFGVLLMEAAAHSAAPPCQ